MPKHHHKKHPSKELKESKEPSVSNPSAFFSPKTSNESHQETQTVNVTVNVDDKEDCCTGCFKALLSSCKK